MPRRLELSVVDSGVDSGSSLWPGVSPELTRRLQALADGAVPAGPRTEGCIATVFVMCQDWSRLFRQSFGGNVCFSRVAQ